MSFLFATVAAIAALNPPRLRPLLPQEGATGRIRLGPLTLGAVLGYAIAVGVALVAGPLLDSLDITEEMWRIAAGLVLIVAGLRYVAFPSTPEEPALQGARSALVPVAFPLLITPELFVLVVALGVGASVGIALGAVAVGLLAVGLAALVPRGARSGTWAAGARFHAAVLVVIGVAIVVEAIRDV